MSGQDVFDRICQNNYKPHSSLQKFYIGYTQIEGFIFIFPALALVLNLVSVINYIRNRKKQK